MSSYAGHIPSPVVSAWHIGDAILFAIIGLVVVATLELLYARLRKA